MSATPSSGHQAEIENATAQSVPANLAKWSSRVWAKIIDNLIIWVPFTVLWFIGMHFTATGQHDTANLFYIAAYVEGVLGWGWTVYEVGTTSQTIGKRLMKIRLVSEDTRLPMGFGHAFLHETAQLFFDMLPLCIGYLRPLVDSKRQTFSDKILGSITVRA